MVFVIIISIDFKHLLITHIHSYNSLLILKYTPSPPILMAVSTTSQLSVDIVATESIYCDNVQCGNMHNETKVNKSPYSNDWSSYHTFTLQHDYKYGFNCTEP